MQRYSIYLVQGRSGLELSTCCVFFLLSTSLTHHNQIKNKNRYASCGSKWHGLSLLDYALLAELAYFDQHDEKVTDRTEKRLIYTKYINIC